MGSEPLTPSKDEQAELEIMEDRREKHFLIDESEQIDQTI
jgi:hypothetical protein